ncbi:sensor histidine kinase, partial [Streptomyces sp. NPDC002537]
VALHELTRTVTTECAATKDAHAHNITIRAHTTPLTVDGDPVLLAHLVRNLVTNAVRHNHHDGHVQADIHGRTLTVTNTGPHVPPETVPYLFEPFRRLRERGHAPGEGAGLGLSIVTSIARAHQAEVDAEANPDGGLTVRVTFP